MSMQLTLVAAGEFESDDGTQKVTVAPPQKEPIEYHGHVPGGMVAVRFKGAEWIAHPNCFKELR